MVRIYMQSASTNHAHTPRTPSTMGIPTECIVHEQSARCDWPTQYAHSQPEKELPRMYRMVQCTASKHIQTCRLSPIEGVRDAGQSSLINKLFGALPIVESRLFYNKQSF